VIIASMIAGTIGAGIVGAIVLAFTGRGDS